MRTTAPFNAGELEHSHIRAAAPEFFGFDGYEEGRSRPGRVETYRDGNIVTLDGISGPWLARQIEGDYAGILVERWSDRRVKEDSKLLADRLNLHHYHWDSTVGTTEVDDDNAVEVLFGGVPKEEAENVPVGAHLQPANV